MEKQKIDVLLATYNGEKYVSEQIDSILNQTYDNINLFISDDGSSDATREILAQYEQKDKRVHVFRQPQNLGYIKNFEFLLQQVESEIYMLADQDDVWLPEKIEKSYELLQEEAADLVFGDLLVVNEHLETIYPSFVKYMKLERKIKKYIHTNRLNYLYNCVTGCTVMAKKKFIPLMMPFPKNKKYVIHDYWIGIIMSLQGKVAYLPTPYMKYRQHGNNQVGTDKISHQFTKLEQVRNLFIEVKLEVFGTFVENAHQFPEEMQELNQKAYDYFQMIRQKKNINGRQWNVFHQLYKTETKLYYLENFVILNLPLIGKGAFAIRHWLLKILGKR